MPGYQPKIYREQGGDKMVAVSGAVVDFSAMSASDLSLPAGGVEAADLAANLKTGFIRIPLTEFREVASNDIQNIATNAGGQLAKNTTPILERVNGATDKALRLNWAAGNTDEVTASFPYPPDLDDTAPVVVNLLLAKDTNTDTAATVAVGYFEGIGDTNAGTNTAALATSALGAKTVTIAAADVGPAPTMASISIAPGTHAADAVLLYGVSITYTRKS